MARRKVDLPRAARAIEDFLTAIGAPVGEDPELAGTGERVARAFAEELLSGYDEDPARILADPIASDAPGLVVLANIQTVTLCPHHLLPAHGVVHVGYLPGGRVAGLGALARLTECFARRLSLQEDLGQNVVDALVAHLGARGAGCLVDLSPACLTARGARAHGARAVTTAYAGVLGDDAALRAELLAAVASARRGGEPGP